MNISFTPNYFDVADIAMDTNGKQKHKYLIKMTTVCWHDMVINRQECNSIFLFI